MPIREELWQFPHTMQLKVMGASDSPLEEAVVAILRTHLDDFDGSRDLTSRPSSKGTFTALSARVTLQNREQVERLYAALNDCPHVKVAL